MKDKTASPIHAHPQASRSGPPANLHQETSSTPVNHAHSLHQTALMHYQQGQPVQALPAARQAVALAPDTALFYNTLGVLLEATGCAAEAINAYQKAVDIQGDYAEAYNNMAIALQSQGHLQQAIHISDKAIHIDPNFAKAYYTKGYCCHGLNQLDTAKSCLLQALMLNPDLVDAYNQLGVILAKQQCYTEAEQAYLQVIRHCPDHAEAYNNLGITLRAQGKLDQAILHFHKALALCSNFPEALYNLAHTETEQGHYNNAMTHCRQALDLQDNYASAHNQLGIILNAQGRPEEAVIHYQKALALEVDNAEFYNNLAIALKELGRFTEALNHYEHALNLEPTFKQAYYNQGNAYKEIGQCDTAVACYDKAIQLDSEYADAHWNRSLALLLKGDLQEGLKSYQWRARANLDTVLYPHTYQKPRWDGTSFTGKRLFIYCEQGLGDTIQMIRFLPQVKALGGMVIVETWAPLIRLLETIQDIDILVQTSDKKYVEDKFDLVCSIMDLPACLHTRLDTIPDQIPYLSGRSDTSTFWKDHLATTTGLKVGIVWAGRPSHGNDHHRSCCLTQFIPLIHIPGITLIGLQKGPAAEQVRQLPAPIKLENIADHFSDLMDTAGALEALDLVISVDTVCAHLAGALGRPVWTLLPYAPDWRWMLDRPDSPWYPTMRLFRQSHPGDWDSVFTQIKEELTLWVTNKKILLSHRKDSE